MLSVQELAAALAEPEDDVMPAIYYIDYKVCNCSTSFLMLYYLMAKLYYIQYL
jgi:hypothetical protein